MLYIVMCCVLLFFFFFFFNDTATTEIYTLSLLDALPISCAAPSCLRKQCGGQPPSAAAPHRSEEHTSELQSPCNLVCRLLLEKKKKNNVRLHGITNPQYHLNCSFTDPSTNTTIVTPSCRT